MEQVHDATAVEQVHDATAVEQVRDATAVEQVRDTTGDQVYDATAVEQVRDTTSEQERGATGEQRKRQMAERERLQEHGAKRREEEPALPIERVDGVEPYPLNAEDRLPYTPVLVNRIQRKTWLLTVFFPERVQTEEELDEIVRKLVEYLLQPGNTQRVLVGVERCPRTGRLHAHIYIDFLRSTRMTRRLRYIQLPGEASALHPHIDSVTGNSAELYVIKYVLKKETKVYGGILGRDIFLHETDDYIVNLIHEMNEANQGNGGNGGNGENGENGANGANGENGANGANGRNDPNDASDASGENQRNGTISTVSDSCLQDGRVTTSCAPSSLSSVLQGGARRSYLREIFEMYKDDILAGRWDRVPEYFLFMHGVRCEKLREMLDDGREETALSHCRLIFVYGPAGCGKTSIARDFAMALYGSGNGLPFYMKPVNRWWDGYRGQPVVILDDPSVRRFRELEQEIKVWTDRYPFIAELKGHSIRANPEWLVIASNYPLEELTNAARNPTFYQALFRRTDNGRRLFHFTADCYKPDTVPVDAETRQLYHRRLEKFIEIIVNSH